MPTTYKKVWDPEEEEWVYVPEEDVPTTDLSIPDVPNTGDASRLALWMTLALCSAGVLWVTRKLRGQQNKTP